MAELQVSIPRDPDWLHTDKVQLVIGSENAASLAASTPADGRVVDQSPAWPDAASVSDEALGDLVMAYTYHPTDVCAALPVGVRAVDEHGNVSAVNESMLQLVDPPFGVRNTAVAPVDDGNGGYVAGAFKVTFTQSKHLHASA